MLYGGKKFKKGLYELRFLSDQPCYLKKMLQSLNNFHTRRTEAIIRYFQSLMNSEFSSVQTVYILQSGEQLVSLQEFERVRDKFDWVDKKVLLTEILHVRTMTSQGCRSIIAVYEDGKMIKTFLNLSADFHPSDLLVQRAS